MENWFSVEEVIFQYSNVYCLRGKGTKAFLQKMAYKINYIASEESGFKLNWEFMVGIFKNSSFTY